MVLPLHLHPWAGVGRRKRLRAREAKLPPPLLHSGPAGPTEAICKLLRKTLLVKVGRGGGWRAGRGGERTVGARIGQSRHSQYCLPWLVALLSELCV